MRCPVGLTQVSQQHAKTRSILFMTDDEVDEEASFALICCGEEIFKGTSSDKPEPEKHVL